uniref:Uncharacterized protein n=1 Tax=Arundo donax TaxID=35708 RepID=A0A0A9CC70_ARUDO
MRLRKLSGFSRCSRNLEYFCRRRPHFGAIILVPPF